MSIEITKWNERERNNTINWIYPNFNIIGNCVCHFCINIIAMCSFFLFKSQFYYPFLCVCLSFHSLDFNGGTNGHEYYYFPLYVSLFLSNHSNGSTGKEKIPFFCDKPILNLWFRGISFESEVVVVFTGESCSFWEMYMCVFCLNFWFGTWKLERSFICSWINIFS